MSQIPHPKLEGVEERNQKVIKAVYDRHTRDCKGCHRPTLFAVNQETGKTIPLDPKALVYRVVKVDADGQIEVVRLRNSFVTHFATCPHAATFSGSRKRAEK